MEVKEVLEKVRNQELSIQEAQEYLKSLPYEDMGFAKLDHHRKLRSGFGEVIYCAGENEGTGSQDFSGYGGQRDGCSGYQSFPGTV